MLGLRGAAEILDSRLYEQRPDGRLRLRVVALVGIGIAHPSLGVDQEVRRPALVAPLVEGVEVVVLDDRVVDAELLDRAANVAGFAFERELGRLNADDHEPFGVVLALPSLEVGQRTNAVDAGVGPEVEQHDVPAQAGDCQGTITGRVEPSVVARRRRDFKLVAAQRVEA